MKFIKKFFNKNPSKKKLNTKTKDLIFADREEINENKRKAGSRRNAGA